MNTEEKIQHQLATNPIILYMKGVPDNPQCGFSGKTVGILKATNIPYAYVNVLEAPFIREKLPKISRWPTYPQLFVNGELVGGCDIVEAMSNEGTLIPLLKTAKVDKTEGAETTALSITEVQSLVQQGVKDATVYVEGEGCDLTLTVVSAEFAGLSEVKKQQQVLATLTEPLASGKLHAVSVKAFTPEAWQALQATKNSGLLQIKL